MLTTDQRIEARRLFRNRPPVIDGTRVIANQALRETFYHEVNEAMARLCVRGARDVNDFCDLAGVPD